MLLKKYILLLCGFLSSAAFAVNLLENGSFEIFSDGKPAKWHQNMPKNFPNVEFKISDKGKSGKYAGQIISNNPATKMNHFIAWIQHIDMKKLEPYTPGKEIMLSFDFAPDAPGTRIRAYVEGFAMGRGFNFIGKTDTHYVGWKNYQLRFKLPENKPQKMYVVLQLLSTGSVMFDNAAIETEPPPVSQTPAAKVIKTAKAPELDLRFKNLPPRNTFVKGTTPFIINFNVPMKDDKFTAMTAEITDTANKRISFQRFDSFGNRIQGQIKIPENLKSGLYRLTCKAFIRKQNVSESILFRIASEKETAGYAVHFRDDNIMLLHGKPFFPIAVCPPYNTPEAYKAYQKAGFNTITAQLNASANKELSEVFYAQAAKYDLNIIEWINFADTAGRSSEALGEHVKLAIKNAKSLPNFIGWMNDEDAFRGISTDKAKRSYEAFYTNAPGYILWVNQAPRGTVDYLRKYVRYSDITGADVYPIPAKSKHSEKPRENIACLGDYTDDFFEAGDFSKPVWMILQAWSWGGKNGTPDKPFPTYNELRFMFYNSITHGATGIAWFDNNHLDPLNKVMVHLGNINHEFHAIEKYILNGKKSNDFSLEGLQDGIKIAEYSLNNKKLLIIVNENDKAVNAVLKCPAPVKLFDTQKKQNFNPADKLNVKLDKFGVLLLTSEQVSYSYPAQYQGMSKNADAIPLNEAVNSKKSIATKWQGSWIWNNVMADAHPYSETIMTKKFNVSGEIKSAWLCVGADNEAVIYLNNQKVDYINGWKYVSPLNLKPYLKQGENTLEIKIVNYNSFGGLLFEGEIKTSNSIQSIYSDADCKFSQGKTYVYGKAPLAPWGDIFLLP